MHAQARMSAHENTLNYPSSPSIPLFLQISHLKKAAATMAYETTTGTGVEGGLIGALPPMEGRALPPGFLSFEDAQDRLVEAMITCWRHHDQERAWQKVRSNWPEALRELSLGDYDARGGDGTSSDVALRPAAQTRAEIAEMEEAFGWAAVLDGEDRRLVALVVAELAAGRREVSWRRMMKRMGLTRGADGLRMRYTRAITAICNARNGGNPQASVSSR